MKMVAALAMRAVAAADTRIANATKRPDLKLCVIISSYLRSTARFTPGTPLR